MTNVHTSTLGEIRRGKLVVKRADRLATQLRLWSDGMVEITVTRKRATRSQQANRYYWGVVLALLSEHTGYTPNELHDYFKQEFLPRHLVFAAPTGEILYEAHVGHTTTTLDALQFTAYLESIRQRAAEIGVVIPDPEDDDGALRPAGSAAASAARPRLVPVLST